MSHLRRISVHVDEAEHGHYHWVLMEEDGDASTWKELEASADSFDMWLDALTEGVCALEKYASDERVGPRVPGEDEDASPVG